jgi:hypothetical protein
MLREYMMLRTYTTTRRRRRPQSQHPIMTLPNPIVHTPPGDLWVTKWVNYGRIPRSRSHTLILELVAARIKERRGSYARPDAGGHDAGLLDLNPL